MLGANALLQLKVWLLTISPMVWRRLLVPAGYSLRELHGAIQVNTVIGQRFAKRQQMQWTPRGAHLLLQTRTRTLDGTLRSMFERWYPGLAHAHDHAVGTDHTAAAA